MSIITSLSYYIPKVDYSNERLIRKKKNRSKIVNKIGINKKFRADKNEYASDLATKSIKKLLFKSNYKSKIDFFINCTQSNDYLLPGNSTIIQKNLSLNKIPCLDVNMGCSGFVYSLCLASSLINSGVAKCILISTSDTYSKFINQKNTHVSSIFGDAATACIIEGTNSKIGFISPHSNKFCSDCNRIRLTAEGQLLLCLGQENSLDLKRLIRNTSKDKEKIKAAIVQSIKNKPKEHFFELEEKPVILRFMSHTGG